MWVISNKFINYLCIAAIFTILYGCTKNEEPISSQLVLNSENNITFASDGNVGRSIQFETTKEWTATSSADWCRISPASGKKGVNTITVNVLENETYDPRKATITIALENYSTVVNVIQSQNNAIIPAEKNYKLDADGQALEFKVKSNVSYTVSTSSEWINYTQTASKGLAEKTLKFTIDENFTISGRKGTISLKSNDISQEIEIEQNCYPYRERIVVSHSETSMAYPLLTGENSGGKISWGDGSQDYFGNGLIEHKFSNGSAKTTVFDIYGTDVFEMKSINSINSITFYINE